MEVVYVSDHIEIKSRSRKKEMTTLTETNENQRHDDGISKSLRNQNKTQRCTVIGLNRGMSTVLQDHSPCPCCNRQLRCAVQQQVVGENVVVQRSRRSYDSLFDICDDDSDEDPNKEDLDELDRMLPGVLAKGIAYTVKSVIAQGYVDKKGSGFDWIMSRAWKGRWAVLVMARTDGQDVDVPLLQIFWDNSSPTPSTVISLDSAVVLPEDNLDTTKSSSNHPFRFKIRHLKKSVNPEHSLQMTRIFSCSEKAERDKWVYLINAALLNYEKEKANSKRLNHLSLSPPRVRGTSRSWAKEDVMPAQLSTARQQNTSTSIRIRLSTPFLFPS